jgi:hypothetical protein
VLLDQHRVGRDGGVHRRSVRESGNGFSRSGRTRNRPAGD